MKLVAQDAFRNLKLRAYKKNASSDQFQKVRAYTTLAMQDETESGVLAPKRINQVELFKRYTQQVLPALERSVEMDLLGRVFQKVDPIVKDSIIQSYTRKYVQEQVQIPEVKSQPDNVTSSRPRDKLNLFINDIGKVQQTQIGMWAPFKFEEYKQYFKHKSPGDFLKNHIEHTKNFSVMITDEGFKTMDFISSSPRNTNLTLENTEASWVQLFNVLKGDFAAELRKLPYRKDLLFQRLFSTGVVFDSIIEILIAELPQLKEAFKDANSRQQFFAALTKELLAKVDPLQANSNMSQLFCQTVKSLQVNEYTIDLLKYVNNPHPIPETLSKERFENYLGYSSTLIFTGDNGAGKSGLLIQGILWAQRNNYITVVVPSAFDWTQLPTEKSRHHETGLVMQPKAAVQWLEQFRTSNEQQLKSFIIDQSIYGKYNLSGQHDEEPEAVPNLYDPRRQYHFKEYEKFLIEEEIDQINDDNQRMSVRLTLKMPKPRTLLEIVDYGIENEFYSTNVIYEVLEQLYNTDKHKVLVAVDGFNWFYRPTSYASFRYASDKGLRGNMPPHHLSLCRAFMHLDGHKIRNGYKIMGSTIYRLHLNDFQPKHIHIPNEYGVKLNGVPLDHFRSFCEYSLQTGMWRADQYAVMTQPQFWMETQGNFAQAKKCMFEHWRDI